MTECLIRSLCCQENMSYELARDLQKKCGVHVVPTSNRHIKLFLWFWEKCLCINEYDNKLSVYSLSTEHIMNSLDSRSHSSSGLPTSCRRKWLTTFIVHWSSTPFVMSRMNLSAVLIDFGENYRTAEIFSNHLTCRDNFLPFDRDYGQSTEVP